MDKEIEKGKVSWWDYRDQHPHKPYEQSEKYGDYFQRCSDYYNKLYVEWLNIPDPQNLLNQEQG